MTELDRWLICGNPFDPHMEDSGCTCKAYDPTEYRMQAAIARRRRETAEEEPQ